VSKVRWGLLVTGGYADVAMLANADSETTEFVAVSAGDPELTKAYAERTGIAAGYGSYDELLAAEDVEAVFIALHPVDHAEWAIKALRAGKHVLVEKPLALTGADAERVFDAAEAAGRQAVENVMFRHHPQTLLAQKLVAEGRIGELRYIYGSCTATLPPDYFRRDRSLGGGGLLDLGVFPLTAIRLFGGSPQRVYAEEVRRDGGADLNYSAVLRLPDDVLAQFEAGQEVARGDSLHIVGTLGRVIVPDPWLGRAEQVEVSLQGPPPHGDPVSEFFPVDPDGSLGTARPFAISRLQFDAVSAAFAEGGTPLPFGRADAVEQARVLEALLESSAHAKAVQPVQA
jgi:xylose dehydrogenase (NAD/NADP)